jgi:hypothetical protein
MRWSMCLCHYSATSGEAPSGPTAGSVFAIVAAQSYRRVVAMVAATAMVAAWPLVQQNQPTLEREVAFPSVACP